MSTEQPPDLDLHVCNALGLSPYEYCQPRSKDSPYFYMFDTIGETRERHKKLGEKVVSAINAQTFGGRLALQALLEFGVTAPLWNWDGIDEQPRKYDASDFLYHGTPKHVGRTLEVRQPYWQDEKGRRYSHGSPAICTSDKPDMPIMRSLLHENSDALKDKAFRLRLGIDARGKRHWFTLQESIDALHDQDASGYLYVITKRNEPDYTKPYFDTIRARYLDEYRIHHNRTASIAIKMTVEDLPPDLLVINATPSEATRALRALHTYNSPRDFSDYLGMPIEPFGESWRLDMYPNIQNL